MQVLEDGKLESHFRYLRMASAKVFLKPRYSTPIYFYGIAIGFVASGFYTVFSYIPVIAENQWVLNSIMIMSGLLLLGRTFWRLILRIFLGNLGLDDKMPPPTHKEIQLRNHLTPKHAPTNLGEYLLIPIKLTLYLILYIIAHAEGEIIKHIDRHVNIRK